MRQLPVNPSLFVSLSAICMCRTNISRYLLSAIDAYPTNEATGIEPSTCPFALRDIISFGAIYDTLHMGEAIACQLSKNRKF